MTSQSKAAGVLRRIFARVDKFFTVDVNPSPIVLADLTSAEELKRWQVFSDAPFGGSSEARLEPASLTQGAAVFSGTYRKAVKDGSSLVRSGFVGINKALPRPQDLSMHDRLMFRVRAHDNHTYVASVRTTQVTGGDEEAWQAPLRITQPGQWEDVSVSLEELVFTFRGRLVAAQAAFPEMPRTAVLAVGLTLAASDTMPPEGEFRLELARVEAQASELDPEATLRKQSQGLFDVPADCDLVWAKQQAQARLMQEQAEHVAAQQGKAGHMAAGGEGATASPVGVLGRQRRMVVPHGRKDGLVGDAA